MDYRKFLRKHLPGSRVLPMSMPHYGPGAILTRRHLTYKGHLKDVLGGTPQAWAVSKSAGSIVYGTITGSRSAKGGFSLLGLITVGASADRKIEATFDVTGVVGSHFTSESQLTIHPKLNALREADRDLWKMINDQFIVTEAFHAQEFKVRFSVAGGAGGSIDLKEIVKWDLGLSADIQWASATELVVANNVEVPFAVRGFTV